MGAFPPASPLIVLATGAGPASAKSTGIETQSIF
jgi:hypothetical protein